MWLAHMNLRVRLKSSAQLRSSLAGYSNGSGFVISPQYYTLNSRSLLVSLEQSDKERRRYQSSLQDAQRKYPNFELIFFVYYSVYDSVYYFDIFVYFCLFVFGFEANKLSCGGAIRQCKRRVQVRIELRTVRIELQ